MKIVYLANIRFPTEKAHGIQIAKMSEQIAQKNELVLVIPWRFNSIKENTFDYYKIKKNFKIITIPSLDLIPLGIPKIGFSIQRLFFALSVFIYLIFKKTDIVYSRDLLLAWLAGFLKKNVFCELHTLPSWLNKKYFKRIKGVIVITQILKNELIEKGIAGDKVLVAPDGVDIEQFDIKISGREARRKLSLPLDKKIIFCNSHLYRWKGVHILAEAAKYLGNDLVVFAGGTKKDIKKFRSQFGGRENILILGHRPYSEMPLYMKAADVLVLPNSAEEKISQYWTSPMKMFEYMAAKRPIVASDLPSIREVLNESNAILVKPDSPEDLAKGIEKSLKEPDFSDKLSLQSFSDVRNYSWKNRVEKIIDFINLL